VRLATVEEHTFLAGPLGPSAIVLDLGANRGAFANEVIERFGVSCLAVEPLREHARNIPQHIAVRELAIGGRNGRSSFHVSADPESSRLEGSSEFTRTEWVRVVTFETFLKEEGLGRVDLVKVDIEGAEKQLFEDTSDDALRAVGQFTVEFHDFLGLLSPEDIARIVARLRGLGFYTIKFTRGNYNWLFFQPDRCAVEHPLLLQYVTRNALYVWRNTTRLLRRR
jgi:FkbM family methyltransferase